MGRGEICLDNELVQTTCTAHAEVFAGLSLLPRLAASALPRKRLLARVSQGNSDRLQRPGYRLLDFFGRLPRRLRRLCGLAHGGHEHFIRRARNRGGDRGPGLLCSGPSDVPHRLACCSRGGYRLRPA